MKIKNYTNGKVGQADLDLSAFGDKVLVRTLKDAVVMYHANLRQGTAKVKGRSEVHGSGAKPWKQKHTGRARAGDKKSPLWRGGGTIFGPHPRDFSYHPPAQQRRVALRAALAGKIRDNELATVDLASFSAPNAKGARAVLAGFENPRRTLLVLSAPNASAWKSFRNFPGVVVKTAAELNAREVGSGGLVLAERAAIDALAARVGLKTKEGVA